MAPLGLQEETREGFVQGLIVKENPNEDEDGKIIEQVSKLRRLDGYQ